MSAGAAKKVLVGLIVIGAYLTTALVSFRLGLLHDRPLYDGLAPPVPYRFVNPPEDLKDENAKPGVGEAPLIFSEDGSEQRTVSTTDAQMAVVFGPRAVAERQGVKEATITVKPLDPARFGLPPEGLEYSGNAYVVEGEYESGGELKLDNPVTVIMRYPLHGEVVLRRDESSWQEIKTDKATESQQVFAASDDLGTFVVATPPVSSRPWLPFAIAGLGLIGAAIGYISGRRRGKKKKAQRRRRKT